MKILIMTGMIAGSYGGSFIPMFWGGSVLSVSSLLFGAAGGFLGIWLGYKLAGQLGLE